MFSALKGKNNEAESGEESERDFTLDWRAQISEREELVEGAEPRARPAHLGLHLRRDILWWRRRRRRLRLRRRGYGLRGSTTSGSFLTVLGRRALWCITGCRRRRRRRRLRRSGAETGGAGDDVEKAPHVSDRLLLVVVLCDHSENDRSLARYRSVLSARRYVIFPDTLSFIRNLWV